MFTHRLYSAVLLLFFIIGCVVERPDLSVDEFALERVSKPSPVAIKGLAVTEYKEDNPEVIRPVSCDFGFLPSDDPNLAVLRENYDLENIIDIPGGEFQLAPEDMPAGELQFEILSSDQSSFAQRLDWTNSSSQ